MYLPVPNLAWTAGITTLERIPVHTRWSELQQVPPSDHIGKEQKL